MSSTGLAEISIKTCSPSALQAVREQVAQYKKLRRLFQYGEFYRVRHDDRIVQWTVVSEDKEEAVGLFFQKLVLPNDPTKWYQARGLDENKLYHFTNRFVQEQVQQEETAAIVLQDNFEAFTKGKQEDEKEDCMVYGSGLMNAGVMLRQAFSGTGFNAQMRMFRDFSSRLYYMKAVK